MVMSARSFAASASVDDGVFIASARGFGLAPADARLSAASRFLRPLCFDRFLKRPPPGLPTLPPRGLVASPSVPRFGFAKFLDLGLETPEASGERIQGPLELIETRAPACPSKRQ